MNLERFSEHAFGFTNSWHHKEVYHLLEKYKRILWLIPRHHSKTVCVTQVYPTWRLWQDPNWRILIATNKYEQGVRSLGVVKRRLEEFGLRPEYTDKRMKWTRDSIILDRNIYSRDPSLSVSTAEGESVGMHSDIILADDLVTDKNINTRDQRRKVQDWFDGVLFNILDPKGQCVVTGNHWHFDDFYVTLKKRKGWKTIIHPAIFNEREALAKKKTPKVLWKEMWPYKTLVSHRDQVGETIFNVQFMNDPTVMKGNAFQYNWLRFIEPKKIPEFIRLVQAWDFAFTEEKYSDWTVCVTFGIDAENKFYIKDIYRDRIGLTAKVRAIENKYKQFKPSSVGVEVDATQVEFKNYLAENTLLPIVPMKSGGRSKKNLITGRIMSLQPFFQTGRIFIPEGAKWFNVFLEEYSQFPRGKHDDILDALEMAMRLIGETDRSRPKAIFK